MPELSLESLREGEACFREVIQNSADPIMMVRESGVICYANAAAEMLLGKASGTLIGEMFGLPLAVQDTVEIDIPRGSDSRTVEMRVVKAVWGGEPAYLALLRDITDVRRAADAVRILADASRVLAGTLDYPKTVSSVAALAVHHLADWCTIDLLEDGETLRRVAVAHRSPAMESIAQDLQQSWSPPSAAPNGLPAVLASGKSQVHHDVSRALLSELAGSRDELPIIKQLGCKSMMVVPLIARGRTLGAIMFVSASAAQRYGGSDLALAEDLAQRAALALDNARLYDEAQLAVRRRDEFLAMLAHELRNPLAAIQNAVDLLRKDGPLGSRQQRARDVIERQGEHMGRLLSDLLDISRVTRGKITLRPEPVDLGSVVHDAVQASQPLIEDRRHELTVSLAAEPLCVNANATRLSQVIVNLLNNAAKYTEPGGRIFLETRRDGDQVVLRVRDNGVGIAREDLPSIFDLFVQAEHTLHRSEGGLGIGLTLVRTLIEMHGGTISAFSEGKDRGSEFEVRLPLDQGSPCEPAAGLAQPSTSKRRIVIVEDNADTRDMLHCLLTLEGHDVEVAEDGLCGIETILRCRPDIALVDIGLPGVDGYQVAQHVRDKYPHDPIRLVAITGYGQTEDAQRALAAGFDMHLVKPVKFEDLYEVLERDLSPADAPANRAASVPIAGS